jgi:hypothetical protein
MTEQVESVEWVNKTKEKIENPQKAEYMARVEDLWRTSLARLVEFAAETDFPEVRQRALTAARFQAQSFGPSAVEAAGQAWNEYRQPTCPPTLEASLHNPMYAAGGPEVIDV